MIYLDYSATTPVDREVLNKFLDDSRNNFNDVINTLKEESLKLKNILNTNLEVIYTSGATESNNMIIKGICENHESGHIITTKLEHSSINECLKYLEKKGHNISYVNLINGIVDLNHLKSLITENTILVTISSVNSETGLLQPINEIGKILKEYPNILFHSDMTQSIGKVVIPLDNIDLISFSAHKFYGLKGIGCLLKREDIKLKTLIYGERKYNLALIKSLNNALTYSFDNINNNVFELNKILREKLSTYKNVNINSNDFCIPHILNISITSTKPETFQNALEGNNVFVSTKSACSSDNLLSESVYALTCNKILATTSIRISISHLTTINEIEEFLNIFDKCYKHIL